MYGARSKANFKDYDGTIVPSNVMFAYLRHPRHCQCTMQMAHLQGLKEETTR